MVAVSVTSHAICENTITEAIPSIGRVEDTTTMIGLNSITDAATVITPRRTASVGMPARISGRAIHPPRMVPTSAARYTTHAERPVCERLRWRDCCRYFGYQKR